MKEKLRPIAFLANLLFLTISGITNFDGVYLIWSTDNVYVRYGIAGILAIAISLLLFYLSSLISEFSSEGRGARLIYGYIIIALFSVFFNFQSFYTRLTKSTSLENSTKEYRDKLLEIEVKADKIYSDFYDLKEFKDSVDYLEAEREAEKRHIQRPGEGTIFAEWDRKYLIATNKYKTQKANYDEKIKLVKEKINSTVKIINNSILNNKQIEQTNAIDKGKEVYNSISNELKIINPNFKEEDINSKNEVIDKPDRALRVILDFISGNKEIDSDQRSSIYLSLFLSFFLDFPLFFTLVALNWKSRQSGNNRIRNNNSNIWQ